MDDLIGLAKTRQLSLPLSPVPMNLSEIATLQPPTQQKDSQTQLLEIFTQNYYSNNPTDIPPPPNLQSNPEIDVKELQELNTKLSEKINRTVTPPPRDDTKSYFSRSDIEIENTPIIDSSSMTIHIPPSSPTEYKSTSISTILKDQLSKLTHLSQ